MVSLFAAAFARVHPYSMRGYARRRLATGTTRQPSEFAPNSRREYNRLCKSAILPPWMPQSGTWG